ncbi:hypothetical protein BVRB_3g058550 [Beta vulgaris subsp. vulgaris]|nr:hypothetical protein BVRB_3g058550 [Beta vulgaris subsp. vulgaris]
MAMLIVLTLAAAATVAMVWFNSSLSFLIPLFVVVRLRSGSSDKPFDGRNRNIYEKGGAGCSGPAGGPVFLTGNTLGGGLSGGSSWVAGYRNGDESKCGTDSLAPEVGERQGDFSGGFTGGGRVSLVGGGTTGGYALKSEPTREKFERDGSGNGGFGRLVRDQTHGSFERGGAGNCGSGGGPGNLAGNCKRGDGTTSCGGRNKEGKGFIKGGSEASGSGGGPGDFSGKNTGDCSNFFAGESFGGEARWLWQWDLLHIIQEDDHERGRRAGIYVGLQKKALEEDALSKGILRTNGGSSNNTTTPQPPHAVKNGEEREKAESCSGSRRQAPASLRNTGKLHQQYRKKEMRRVISREDRVHGVGVFGVSSSRGMARGRKSEGLI